MTISRIFMMRVVGCPSCEQNLAVEEFVPSDAVIQCPFCSADNAVANMAPSRLPVAVVLEMPAVEVSEEAPETDDALDDVPTGEDGEIRGAVDVGSAGGGSAAEKQQAEAGGDSGAVVGSKEPTEGEYGLAAEGDNDATAKDADSEPVSVPTRSVTKRRRKRGPSMVALMVQVVLGGVIGIGGTILGLLWLPGSLRRDPFEVGPSIGKVAPWIVPAHYRPASTADNSDKGADAKRTNARNTSKANGSRTKAPKTSEETTETVAEFSRADFERRAQELEKSLEGSANGKDESTDDLELPILGSEEVAMEDDPLNGLSIDSEEEIEEPAKSKGDEEATSTDEEPSDETEKESKPAEDKEITPASDEVPVVPTEDSEAEATEPDNTTESTEPEATTDEAKEAEVTDDPKKEEKEEEVDSTKTDEPLESTEPSDSASSGEESATLAKAMSAADELTRVLNDKELPIAQQREAAKSFYAAICGLSEVTGPEAIDTLVKAAGDNLHAQVIAHGAGSYLDRAETLGKPLVVVGKVTSAKAIGSGFEIKINLATKEPREVVLVAKGSGDSPVQADDEIVALGVLTDIDAAPIEGYEGKGKVLSQARIGRIVAAKSP
jgi:hypothetical protein